MKFRYKQYIANKWGGDETVVCAFSECGHQLGFRFRDEKTEGLLASSEGRAPYQIPEGFNFIFVSGYFINQPGDGSVIDFVVKSYDTNIIKEVMADKFECKIDDIEFV